MLAIDADALMAQAKSDDVKAECRKLYEVIRYSDPMSDDELSSIESQIRDKIAELFEAVKTDDFTSVSELANGVVILLSNRNQKCKVSKL